ncbi:uncharacterized protein LOC126966473 isoform X1 [Leptidea sinapis]|uniref:uncharacterized protein LOC126966473 isoform X1 n=1 Tax=Leptidea sinapis TaxID=189913 RepID=UPI0021299A64|nr:uncharacterized protein LOC126966473 isoform X1 [Leptidea sinapis]XP_050666497.1 uncharacterized protein LOC126966473 isoform X1 [Leptidea sinapis]
MTVAEKTNNEYFLSFLPTVNSPPASREITGISASSYRPYNEDYPSVQRSIERQNQKEYQHEPERKQKDKKWSIGKLFRRKKKEEDSGTTSQSDDGISGKSTSKRKSKKKKRTPGVNNFDHIVIRDTRRAQSLANSNLRDVIDDAILSDPSAGFLNYKTKHQDELSDYNDQTDFNKENNRKTDKFLLDTPKKTRRSRLKARVEALRNSMKGESSSDEESLKSSNSSSMLRFRSEDSLMRSRDSSLNKRSRSARNERYIKRLSRDEENQLNKEAELLQQGYTKAEVEMMTRTPTSQSSGYGTCKRESTNNSCAIEQTNTNDYNRRTLQAESVCSFPSNQSYPSSINFNAKINNEHINYSIKYPNNNIQRNSQYPSIKNNREFTPVSNEYANPDSIMSVKLPLGNIGGIKNEVRAPPTPPPRDMQRKVVTPLSMCYNHNSTDKKNTQNNYIHGVPNNDFERIMRRSQERTIPSVNGLRRPISSSEDHIAMVENEQTLNHRYKIDQPRRPASVSAEPNHYSKYMNSSMWKKRLEDNKSVRPDSVQLHQDYLYYADQSPRSRRPISIKTSQNINENQYLSDSQTAQLMESAHRKPRNATDFWRKIDDAEKQRKHCSIPNRRASSEYRSNTQLYQAQPGQHIIEKGKNEHTEKSTRNPLKWRAQSEYKTLVSVDPPQQNTDIISKTHTRHKSDTFNPNTFGVASDDENNSEQRKSTNLDDALNELEAIYNSLGLGDEDLLDRAERRELMTPKFNENCNDWNGNNDNIHLQSQPSTPLRRISRRSTLPDKLQDDMAFRRMNSFNKKEKPNYKDAQAQISYMLASPVYIPYASDDDRQSERNEPDIVHDDVVYRNIKDTNSRLKTMDPQPPFGIPVGPVSPAPQSDYLHATPENRIRYRFIPKKSPDLVADDLAYRSLRKDNRQSSLFNGSDYNGLNDNNQNMTEYPASLDTSNLKKKRAVRSLSANIFSMIQREIDDTIKLAKPNGLQKTYSNSDVMKRLRDTFEQSDSNQREHYPRNKVKQRHNTINLFANNNYTSTPHFAKDDSFIHSDDKLFARSSSCDKATNSSPLNSSPKRSSKGEFQQVLSILAQEAMDTSNKLGVALAELDKNKNKNDSADHQKQVNDNRLSLLSDLTSNNLSSSNVDLEPNNAQFSSKAKNTEDSLLALSDQLNKVEHCLKHGYEKEITCLDEVSSLVTQIESDQKTFHENSKLQKTEKGEHTAQKIFSNKIFCSKTREEPETLSGNTQSEHVTKITPLKFHPSNPFLCTDEKVSELNEMKAFKELKDGISDLIAGITEVHEKIFVSKTDKCPTNINDKEVLNKSTVIENESDLSQPKLEIFHNKYVASESNNKIEKGGDADSTEYNSSEELATIFNFDKRPSSTSKSTTEIGNHKPNDEKRPDLDSPKLVRSMNQHLRRLSIDESTSSQSNALPNNVVPWRAKRQNNCSQNDDKGENNTKSKRNWHDSSTLMLACSYTLMLSQNLAELDWLTLFGLLLAMITFIAMLIV